MQSRSQAHNERAFWVFFMPISFVAIKIALSMRRPMHSAAPTIICTKFIPSHLFLAIVESVCYVLHEVLESTALGF